MEQTEQQEKQPAEKRKWFAMTHWSLKTKTLILLSTVCLSTVLVFFFAFYQVRGTLSETNRHADNYYSLNKFLDNFVLADRKLQEYMRWQEDVEPLRVSNQAMEKLELYLAELPDSPQGVNKEQYMLQHALKNSYEVYRQKRNSVLARLDTKQEPAAKEDYRVFIKSGAQYIETYAKQLLRQVLRDDQSYFEARIEESNRLYFLGGLLGIFLLVTIGFLFYAISMGILKPLLMLSKAVEEVSKENFDIPDVEVKNRDEIYYLAHTFNHMKRTVKASFHALREKNEIAEKLHIAEMNAMQAEQRAEQARMEQLQSQINPHFLFNTLNVISRTARREKAPKSEKLILALARLFRHSLKTDDGYVTVEHEMGIINDYISIQQSRFGDRVGILWRLSKNVNPEMDTIPTFLLQPVVENAIIHGLEPKIEGGIIRVHLKKKDGIFTMTVTDNGVGMDRETLAHLMDSARPVRGDISGIGMSNIAKRLDLLGVPNNFIIRSRLGKGTSVIMRIPCENMLESKNEKGEALPC